MKKLFAAAATLALVATPLLAQDEEALAAAAQNPLASLISLPFQNNTTFDGDDSDVLNVLNIQPVWPFALNEDWNLITRTIVPVISAPSPADDQINGVGDTSFTGWFSPSTPVHNITWGIGPVASLPTATKDALGTDQWGLGASAVGVWIDGPWVAGALVNNVWGLDSTEEMNSMLFQYFVNYNLDDGWYLVSAPIITADWNADSSDRWVVPFGGGAGKIVRIGKLPVNINAHLY